MPMRTSWLPFPGRIARRMQKGMAWVSMGAESKNRECDDTGRGSGIVQRAVSGGSGDGDFMQRVAARGGAADVDEQSRSGSGGEAAGADCLWRGRGGGGGVGKRFLRVSGPSGGGPRRELFWATQEGR